MSDENEAAETPIPKDKRKQPGTQTMFELTKSMMKDAVNVVVQQSEESDKRVADAYEKGLDAVVRMANDNAERDERRAKLYFRMGMVGLVLLGAVALGAGAVKLFGVFEIGGEVSSEAAPAGDTDP
jgi:hypothetical protein